MNTKKNFKFYNFRIIIEPEKPEGYHGFVPLLRGLHTFGDTIEEVKKNLKEAIICHIQGLLKDGETIPKEEDTLELIQTFSEKEFVVSR
jgi:predicted RNase H-like HicB family nuclease